MKKSIILLALVFLIFGCNNDIENQEVSKYETDGITQKTTTVYKVTPTVGNFTPKSSTSVTLKGSCGSYNGGTIQAKILSMAGSQVVVQISKQDGTKFSVAGIARVKTKSVCGTDAGTASYTVGMSSVNITLNTPTLTQGVAHFYPVVESATGGTKFYAEPLMVYTIPSYAPSPWKEGTLLATVDGVGLYASGTNLIGDNLTYQCTRFCNNYYAGVYGINIVNTGVNGGHAYTWFDNASSKKLLQFVNGGTIAPRVGDILCLKGIGKSNPYGHVGIITEVSATEIKMANQNGGSGLFYPIGWTLARSVNKISSPSGFIVQGWLRKP